MSAPAPAEQVHLDRIAADSWYAKGLNTQTVEYCARVFSRFFKGRRCLEMGPAEGVMTPHLYRAFAELTLVEGAERFCRDLESRFPDAAVVHSLFEDFSPPGRFDTIVLGHVLEHVDSPAEILRRASAWLARRGHVLRRPQCPQHPSAGSRNSRPAPNRAFP